MSSSEEIIETTYYTMLEKLTQSIITSYLGNQNSFMTSRLRDLLAKLLFYLLAMFMAIYPRTAK